jgi:hypothetical protein
MNKTTQKILNWCKQHDVQLTAHHLLGLNNSQADRLSWLYPQHEWSLADHLFTSLDCCWGPHSVDWMVSAENAHLPQFNSHFFKVGAEVVDTLTQCCCHDNNWVVPPIALILKVVTLIQHQQAMAMIIIPHWEGKQWFSNLMDLCVEAPISFPNHPSLFKWFSNIPPEPLHNPMWCWIACRISGAHTLRVGLPTPTQC